MLRRHVFIALLLGVALTMLTRPSPAAAPDGELESWIRQQVAERRITGAGIAVLQGGKLRKLATYGYQDLDSRRKIEPTTLFSVASITKSFTAVAVMTLVEAGRLRLDDPIGTHLPQLPAAWRDIPVRRLLNHTSGLPDMALDGVSMRMSGATAVEALAALERRPFDFPPGGQYRYNQTNYLLLGMLIEKLSGKSFGDYMQQKVLRPGGARSVVLGTSETGLANRSPVFTPYRFDAGPRPTLLEKIEPLPPELWTTPPHAYPAGGLNISISDFARWLSRLLEGKILTPASLRELWTPAMLADGTIFKRPPSATLWDGSGLGWLLGTDTTHPFVGGSGGVRCAFFYYPKDDIAVIVLTNTQGTGPESLADGIARRFLQANQQ